MGLVDGSLNSVESVWPRRVRRLVDWDHVRNIHKLVRRRWLDRQKRQVVQGDKARVRQTYEDCGKGKRLELSLYVAASGSSKRSDVR